MFSEANQRSRSQEKMFSNSSPKHLYQAKLFILDNLSELLKQEDVANYLHISSRHLYTRTLILTHPFVFRLIPEIHKMNTYSY